MKIYPKMPCSNTMATLSTSQCNRKLNRVIKKIRKSFQVNDVSRTDWYLLVTIVIVILIILLCLLLPRDNCQGQRLKEELCQNYNEGFITGDLCYSICIEESIPLSHCFKQSSHYITYKVQNSLIKIQREPSAVTLPQPISLETFHTEVSKYLKQTLGQGISPALIDRILEFADFNNNGELDYAESNSLWQLVHIRQFLILLAFQEESTFPRINGTCGSVFSHDYISSTPLYQKKSDGSPIMHYFFPNYNRWLLPSWEKRANIGVGLLELASTLTESFSSKFYMCDVKPTNFGVSQDFEAKVVELDSLITERELIENIENQHCFFDSECYYGNGCSMLCDINRRRCSSIPKRPVVSVFCDILKDYILFDSPDDFKYRFESLISQCQSLTFKNYTIPQNVIPAKITQFLWNQVKNKPVNWLKPKVVKRSIPNTNKEGK